MNTGDYMKLFEKMCFKLGTKVGTALYGGNLTPEQKREIERNAYQEMLAEERMKASASRGSCGSRSASGGRCCSNCKHYIMGECFYYYEGHPGYSYSSYHRFDYHGETRDIYDPDGTVCNGYERRY